MFTLVVFLLTRLRRRRWRGCPAVSGGGGGKDGGGGRGGRRSRQTQYNFKELYPNFFFLLFHFSKNVPIQY